MNKKKNLISRISGNPFARNIVLIISGILVFLFLVIILLNVYTRHNKSEAVPDFSGLSMEEALKAAKKSSLRIEVNDSLYVPAFQGGIILDQLPKPGTHVKSGRRVFVTVNSFRQRMVQIPYVTGYSLRQARNILQVTGLEIEKLIYRQDLATNNVLEQRFGETLITRTSDIEAEVGSGVTLVVGMSSDHPSPTIPKVIGFPLNEAKNRLWESGLNVGSVVYDRDITLLTRNEARVYSQSPEQGTRTAPGTPVTIKLTLSQEKVATGSSSSDSAAKSIIASQQAKEREKTETTDGE